MLTPLYFMSLNMRLPSHQTALLLFSLYLAQGLPVGFMTHALPVILRSEGVSLKQIAGFGLLMLPWSLKVLWAPLIDHARQYRIWLIPLQGLMLGSVLLLGCYPITALDQPQSLWFFFSLLLFMNFASATQDIATDGLAVNLLSKQQLGWGYSLQVIGSRLGFIVGGGGMIWAVGSQGWQWAFMVLALLIALNSLPVIILRIAPKPPVKVSLTAAWYSTLWSALVYFYAEPERRAWLWVLLSFKISDGLTGAILKTLMVDVGLSLSQIAWGISLLGALAALIAALLIIPLLHYFSRHYLLWGLLGLKVLILLAYSLLAKFVEAKMLFSPSVWFGINVLEEATAAMLLVLILSWVMHYSRSAYAASDFTLQVAIMATIGGVLYSLSGWGAQILGYSTFLTLCSFLAVACCIPIFLWLKTIKTL